jgi:hypothetical protein
MRAHLSVLLPILAFTLFGQESEQAAGSVYTFAGVGQVANLGLGSYGNFGGGVSFAGSSRISEYAEAAFVPLTGALLGVRGLKRSDAPGLKVNAFDLNGGMRFHLGRDNAFRPYAGGGAGIFYGKASYTERAINGTTLTVVRSGTSFAVHGSLGAKIYLAENFGLAPELRLYRMLDGSSLTTWRVALSVFCDFGGAR